MTLSQNRFTQTSIIFGDEILDRQTDRNDLSKMLPFNTFYDTNA